MTKKIFVVALFLMNWACAKVDVIRLSDQVTPKSELCSLEIFGSESELTRSFTSLCLINSSTGQGLFDDRSVKKALDQARPKACECGADAMVVKNSETAASGTAMYGKSSISILAIKFNN